MDGPLELVYKGQIYPAYHLWHPHDHIHVERLPHPPAADPTTLPLPLQVGDQFLIQEAFDRNPTNLVNDLATVTESTLHSCGIAVKIGPITLGSILHQYTYLPSEKGVQVQTLFKVGLGKESFFPLRYLVNEVINPKKK